MRLRSALCKSTWTQNIAHHLLRTAALRQAQDHRWPAPLLFKGSDFIENLYFDPGHGPVQTWMSSCRHILSTTQSSLLARFPSRPPHRSAAHREQSKTQCSILVNGALLEIHAVPAPRLLCNDWVDQVYERGYEAQLDGMKVRFPNPTDRLCLWLVNQLKAGFIDGPLSLVDLSLILRSMSQTAELSWTALREEIKIRGLANAFELAMLRLRTWGIYPEPLPSSSTVVAHLANHLCVSENAPSRLPHPIQSESLKIWLCPPSNRLEWIKERLRALRMNGWPQRE